jgi:polysaccharide biosynthesis protein PslH
MPKPKILVVATRFPFPLEKGDKLRLFHQLKMMHLHFEIYLVALSTSKIEDAHLEEVQQYCASIHIIYYNKSSAIIRSCFLFFNGLPMQVNMFNTQALKQKINVIAKTFQPHIIYAQLARTAELVKHLQPLVLDFQDAFSANYARASNKSKGLWKFLYGLEAKRMRLYEQNILPQIAAATIISNTDKARINSDKIHVVKNGIDTDFFTPQNNNNKKYDIVFVGNLGYQPNAHAAQFLAKEILPLLLKAKPKIKILIAGAAPSKNILVLQNENVTVQAWLQDIRQAYDNGKIFVAPLFSGAGMQNKILEAMAMQVPCITTQLVADGLDVKNLQQILIANSAQEFCDTIIKLLNGSIDSSMITTNATKFIADNYTWQGNTQSLISLFQGFIANSKTAITN